MIGYFAAVIIIVGIGWAVKLFLQWPKDKILLMEEIKYELLFVYIGGKSMVEDFFKMFKNKTDLPRKPEHIMVITGGLKGIGLEVIRMLLECDVTVVVGCREVEKGEHFANKMRMEGCHYGRLDFKKLDLTSLESIRNFAGSVKTDYPRINALINNAGVLYVPFAKTEDGFESQNATNYLGHFLLTHLLLDNLTAAGTEEDPSRIVNLSSVAHEIGEINYDDFNSENNYVSYKTYAQTKLAILWFSIYLNGLLKKRGLFVKSYAVHPGVVNTGIFRDTLIKKITPFLLGLFFKPPDKGAIPIVFCAISDRAKNLDGCYITNCEKKDTPATRGCEDEQAKLFEYTMKLLKIEEFGKI